MLSSVSFVLIPDFLIHFASRSVHEHRSEASVGPAVLCLVGSAAARVVRPTSFAQHLILPSSSQQVIVNPRLVCNGLAILVLKLFHPLTAPAGVALHFGSVCAPFDGASLPLPVPSAEAAWEILTWYPGPT